jgi:hypothetical protein
VPETKVVEIRGLTTENVVVPLVRFVLLEDGTATTVELQLNGARTVEDEVEHGIPGHERWVYPRDGLEFMERLPYVLHATHLWATPVFEMDAAEAMKGIDG